MIDYGLKDKVAIITGANNPWGIGATTAIAFAREGAKVVLVYKKVDRPFDATKMDRNGVDRNKKRQPSFDDCLMERVTRLELATSTLARWRSTG